MLENPLQRELFAKLMLKSSLGFNELWNKKERSNKIAYHLKHLCKIGLVSKTDNKYSLSEQGRALSAHIGSDGTITRMPTVAYLLIIKNGKKFLCQRRRKEPFRGYLSFVSGSVDFGTSSMEYAKKDAERQTGLTIKSIQPKGIEEVITYDGGQKAYHHVLIAYDASARGKLKQTIGKENVWLTKKQIKNEKHFPKIALDDYLDQTKEFTISEGERHMKNGSFVGGTLKRKHHYKKSGGKQ